MLKTVFYILSFITVASAIYTVTCRNLARAVFVFFATLFCLAGIYVFAFADFVAITQIMVYVGGIVILMLFGIMLSNRKLFEVLTETKAETKLFPISVLGGIALSLLVFAGLLNIIWLSNLGELAWIKSNIASNIAYQGDENSANSLGVNFMTSYLLPFETISVYLLAVLIGAAYLARRKRVR
ncbi:NADH-quinone oxidoreductase subunit J [Solitalea lacus]|uniref:NADH-quinone oxidoreductase subunit J family protein n=1 Tax=Solitalea lacus TaxID=2911172 RepID=UPI001EDB9442|nr:NADH-quinone oxidoreductase subunit J [Solitalea lacus]UKJ08891.1 NADH-quinone oxidoreductase subunit J [Solitalea lacus]